MIAIASLGIIECVPLRGPRNKLFTQLLTVKGVIGLTFDLGLRSDLQTNVTCSFDVVRADVGRQPRLSSSIRP